MLLPRQMALGNAFGQTHQGSGGVKEGHGDASPEGWESGGQDQGSVFSATSRGWGRGGQDRRYAQCHTQSWRTWGRGLKGCV